MALTVSIIDNMTNATDDDLSGFQTDMLEQPGVVDLPQYTTPFKVTATGTPDKNSNTAAGVAYIPNSTSSPVQYYRIVNDASIAKTHDDTSSNPRIDAVVLFLDLGASPNADADNVASIEIVKGSEAGSPTAPTDGDITSDLGASTWVRLADVDIANPFVSITSGDITDQRQNAYIRASKIVAPNQVKSYGYLDSNGDRQLYSEVDSNDNIVTYNQSGTAVEVVVPTTGDISAAISTLSSGGLIRALPGTHLLSSGVDLSNTAIKLKGYGLATVIQSNGVTGNLLTISAVRVAIENLILDLNSESDIGIAIPDAGDNFLVRDVFINNIASGDDGIQVGTSANVFNGIISGCRFVADSSNVGEGIVVDNGQRISITGNFGVDLGNAVRLTANASDCLVVGNLVDGSITNSSTSSTIANNEIY